MFFNLSFPHWLVIVSILISLFGTYLYVKDTLIGKTKPNRVSFAMWSLGPLIGTLSAVSGQADPWATTGVFLASFNPFLVFLASFLNKQSYWKLTAFDFLCGLFSAFGLIALVLAKSPELAILFAILGDGFAALPTVIKSWKYPETETGLSYITSLMAILLVIPSIPRWNIENSGFQIYLILVDATLVFAVYKKRLFNRPTKTT